MKSHMLLGSDRRQGSRVQPKPLGMLMTAAVDREITFAFFVAMLDGTFPSTAPHQIFALPRLHELYVFVTAAAAGCRATRSESVRKQGSKHRSSPRSRGGDRIEFRVTSSRAGPSSGPSHVTRHKLLHILDFASSVAFLCST